MSSSSTPPNQPTNPSNPPANPLEDIQAHLSITSLPQPAFDPRVFDLSTPSLFPSPSSSFPPPSFTVPSLSTSSPPSTSRVSFPGPLSYGYSPTTSTLFPPASGASTAGSALSMPGTIKSGRTGNDAARANWANLTFFADCILISWARIYVFQLLLLGPTFFYTFPEIRNIIIAALNLSKHVLTGGLSDGRPVEALKLELMTLDGLKNLLIQEKHVQALTEIFCITWHQKAYKDARNNTNAETLYSDSIVGPPGMTLSRFMSAVPQAIKTIVDELSYLHSGGPESLPWHWDNPSLPLIARQVIEATNGILKHVMYCGADGPGPLVKPGMALTDSFLTDIAAIAEHINLDIAEARSKGGLASLGITRATEQITGMGSYHPWSREMSARIKSWRKIPGFQERLITFERAMLVGTKKSTVAKIQTAYAQSLHEKFQKATLKPTYNPSLDNSAELNLPISHLSSLLNLSPASFSDLVANVSALKPEGDGGSASQD